MRTVIVDHQDVSVMDEMAFEPIEEKGNRNYKCNVCGKYFYRKCHINRHMIVHAGQERYNCKLCTMQFVLQSDLNKHMFLHSRDPEYKCDICGKKFSQSGVLSRHKAVHYEEKKYFECMVCFKQYTQKGSLMTHLMVHDSKVQYGCGECRREFTDKASFVFHVQRKECMGVYQQPKHNEGVAIAPVTHISKLREHAVMSGETKLHECKLCFKQFSYRKSFSRHFHTQHPNNNCGCRSCEKRFSDEKICRIDKDGIEHKEICSETLDVDQGVKPEMEFGCSNCCKQFRSKEMFVMHVQAQECTEPFKDHDRENVGAFASVSGCMPEELKKSAATSDNGIGNVDGLRTIKEEVICKEDFTEESYNRIELKEEIS